MVMMCLDADWFNAFNIAATVVDLPEPVGPVTNIKPLGRCISSEKTAGECKAGKLGTSCGMTQNTTDMPRACSKTFT